VASIFTRGQEHFAMGKWSPAKIVYDTYQQITDKIIAMIEKGAGQWQMPWHSVHGEGLRMPRNPLSGTKYRGLNIAMLWGAGEACGSRSQLWATYNQWRDAGAQARKGEKSILLETA